MEKLASDPQTLHLNLMAEKLEKLDLSCFPLKIVYIIVSEFIGK